METRDDILEKVEVAEGRYHAAGNTLAHGDHFSNKIFDYMDRVKKYIISSDVIFDEKLLSSGKIVTIDPDYGFYQFCTFDTL